MLRLGYRPQTSWSLNLSRNDVDVLARTLSRTHHVKGDVATGSCRQARTRTNSKVRFGFRRCCIKALSLSFPVVVEEMKGQGPGDDENFPAKMRLTHWISWSPQTRNKPDALGVGPQKS